MGKTTTSINLGASLAAAGYATVTVELDLAMANLVDFLDIDIDVTEATTLHDVLAGKSDVEAATYETDSGLSVVPSGTDLQGYAETDLRRLPDVVQALRWHYDIVLLDTPAGLSEETVRPLQVADETILVSTPRVASVRNVQNTKQLAERVDCDIRGLLLTKSGTGASPGAERVAEFLDVELLGHVPEDEAVPHSQDKGRPVVSNAPNSGAAIAYRKVASRLVEADRTGREFQGQMSSAETSETAETNGTAQAAQREDTLRQPAEVAADSGGTRDLESTGGEGLSATRQFSTDGASAAQAGQEPAADSADDEESTSGRDEAAEPADTDEADETVSSTEPTETDGTPTDGEKTAAVADTEATGGVDNAQDEATESADADESDSEDDDTQQESTDASEVESQADASGSESGSGDTESAPADEGETSADVAVSVPAEEEEAATSADADESTPAAEGAPATEEDESDETDADGSDDADADESDDTDADGSDDADATERGNSTVESTPREPADTDGDATARREPTGDLETEADGGEQTDETAESQGDDKSVASRVLSLFSF
ncbi:AAA family ATPase [Halomicroarcula sp. GCM10025324]|uniref:AAA family ATPase n=1 Tax=Haloarcula TaxID=2237 RepID=UPI003609CD39